MFPLPLKLLLAAASLAACETGPPPPPTPSIPPCPAGMVGIGGGGAVLGRDDPDFFQDQIPVRWHAVRPFCIEPYPFPGEVGDMWLEDGIYAGDLPEWESILSAHGRRLCRVEELVWATAEGPANRPYLSGEARGACESAHGYFDLRPLGGWPDCVNAYGVRDSGVVSSWAVTSPWVDDGRTDHKQLPYVVQGGTFRDDTFYAPTNFGLHAHDADGSVFSDDQLRVCADPAWGGADDSAWVLFQQAAALQGTFEGTLDWFRRNGVGASNIDVLAPSYVPQPLEP